MTFRIEEPDVVTLDRSTLERWADCPRQSWLLQSTPDMVGRAAYSGNEVHGAISETLKTYLFASGQMTPTELVDSLETNLRCTRPDLQPDAIAGMRSSAWSWAKYICDKHPDDVLLFDGGTGDRSGQVSRDLVFSKCTIRVTSEIDLLTATESPDVLREDDYKTGWKDWGYEDVHESFQFQLHWWLLSEVYPAAQQLETVIWGTRFNRRTPRIRFNRSDLKAINTRVMTAAGNWYRWREAKSVDDVEAYPFAEKCRLCPVTIRCSEAKFESMDPAEMCDRLVALDAASDDLRKRLSGIVDKSGKDIVTPLGNAFGVGKPKSNRKPTKSVYSVGTSEPDSEE